MLQEHESTGCPWEWFSVCMYIGGLDPLENLSQKSGIYLNLLKGRKNIFWARCWKKAQRERHKQSLRQEQDAEADLKSPGYPRLSGGSTRLRSRSNSGIILGRGSGGDKHLSVPENKILNLAETKVGLWIDVQNVSHCSVAFRLPFSQKLNQAFWFKLPRPTQQQTH